MIVSFDLGQNPQIGHKGNRIDLSDFPLNQGEIIPHGRCQQGLFQYFGLLGFQYAIFLGQ